MRLEVTGTAVNVRSGPSTDATVLTQVRRGTVLEEVAAAPWRLVRLPDGREGWIHGAYVTEAKDGPVEATQTHRAWRVAKSLDVLLAQIDRMAPKRGKAYDGSIGDEAHAARKSDHNPNADGVVLARDFTHDPAHGADMARVTEALRLSKDPRLAFVIHAGRIFSSTTKPWTWRKYNGDDPHRHHAHVSVVSVPSLYDDVRQWGVSTTGGNKAAQ